MKLSALFTVLLVLAMSARPAHALTEWGEKTQTVALLATGGGYRSNVTGGNGGSGGGTVITNAGIGGHCNSPENATVLLALLCGAGLLTGRKLGRERKPVIAAAL